MVDSLDRRKDEAIERTFQQVATNFANIFETLVPAGRGELVIQRKSTEQVRNKKGFIIILVMEVVPLNSFDIMYISIWK